MKTKKIGISMVLTFFIMLSVCMLSAGTLIVIQLFSAINNLYEKAQPPHFLQMHSGDVDVKVLDDLAESDPHVTDWQLMEMLNVDNTQIWVTKPDGTRLPFSDCLIDLGIIVQPEKYDLLLDTENQRVTPARGEIGVPLILLDQYDMQIGDTVTLSDGTFSTDLTVTALLRDAQMNSTLCSSTRFLMNEEDWQEVRTHMGTVEYIIEYYFDDPSYASEFQTKYENSGMPKEGQAITYTLLKLVSGLPDLMTVMILILMSIILMLIAAMCLRFTILAAMEEEIEDIGILKAIGVSFRDIRKMYLDRYRLLIVIGCVLGCLVAVPVNQMLISHITAAFGKPSFSILMILFPVLAAVLIYLADNAICRKILKRVKQVSVIDTIKGQAEAKSAGKRDAVRKTAARSVFRLPVDWWMSWKQLLLHKRSWLLMTFVVAAAYCMMLLSTNVLTTFRSPAFITYMGQQKCDMMISVTSTERLAERCERVKSMLESDSSVIETVQDAFVVQTAQNTEGEWENLHITCSESAGSGLQYLEGSAPQQSDEIALSYLNSKKYGVKVNDQMTVVKDENEMTLRVCGIYQDVSNGGYTAKMKTEYRPEDVYRYDFLVRFQDGTDVPAKADIYAEEIGTDANVKSMDAFVQQTLSGLTNQFGSVVCVIVGVAIGLMILITSLLMLLILIKNRKQTAIQRVTGFSVRDIRKQYVVQTLLASLLGLVLGGVLILLFGEAIVSGVIGMMGMGMRSLTFITVPWLVILIYPLILLAAALITTYLCTGRIKSDVKLMQLVKG
ncbi:MAG: ABC transporter permease [Oscillospiraceae bacterium]|nr:ABC transporter permease [Oscillospiraceae bacterium]